MMTLQMERIVWIDEMKGFLLLLVCLFHTNNSWYGLVGFMFNMPAFFFISGYLFNGTKFQDYKSFLCSKMKSLLFPYFTLSFFFLLLTPMLYVPNGYGSSWMFLRSSMIDILQGFSGPYTVPLWFVYVLFSVSVLYYSVWRVVKGIGFIVVGAIVVLLLSWYMSYYNESLPCHLDSCLISLFFFSLGHLFQMFRGIDFLLQIKKSKLILFDSVFFILYILGYMLDGPIDIRTCSLGENFFGFLLGTIGGVLFIFTLFFLLQTWLRRGWIKSFFVSLSQNALVVLTVHYWALMILLWFYDFSRPPWFSGMALCVEVVSVLIFIGIFKMKYLCVLIGKKQ